ncbi:MAG: apolipoprotein N-acyltransferase [Pseudobdellovibrio sp.]
MSIIFQYLKSIPRPYLLAILSGLLVGTSYIPFPGWALLFCYTPLWICILELNKQNSSLKKIFFFGWISQFILTLIGFNWIYYVSSEFGHLHWIISASALIAFSASMHIYIPLSGVLAVYIIRKKKIENVLVQLLILSLTLALIERVWPSIFNWNLAYSLLWMRFPLFQWADMVGFWGLSTWILLIQAFVTYSFLIWKKDRKLSIQIIGAVLAIISFLSGFGLIKEKNWSKTDAHVQFAVVQGNIGNAEKIQSEQQDHFQSYILGIYTKLTDDYLKTNLAPDILLWPETAMPFALDVEYHNRFLQHDLLQKVNLWNFNLLTGGYSQSRTKIDHLGYPLTRNSVFFISPHFNFSAEPYNKTQLLVFGEYLPFGEQFPFLYKLFPFVGVYERGLGPAAKTIQLRDNQLVTLGTQICYESLDSEFSRGLANKGAQIFFNVTNDSWFGSWAEPIQHNIMTLARGVENRRPLIRSTNTGVSSAILANGQILEESTSDTTWTHTFKISYLKNPPKSFYTSYGHLDWILWLILLIFLALRGKYVRD